jgi:hypothetical protein
MRDDLDARPCKDLDPELAVDKVTEINISGDVAIELISWKEETSDNES